MLGSLGLWSSSKGMVLVPNLSGLTNTQAESAILSAGLTFSGSSSTTTSNVALSNQIVSQLPNANDLVPYESSVSFIYYNYVASTTTTTTTAGSGGGTTTTTTATQGTPAPITMSNLTYTATGSTTGTLSWTTNGDTVLFTGSATNYPSPYNYGAYTSYYPSSPSTGWGGRLVNMVEDQSYTVTVSMYGGASQTITFTHDFVVPTTTTTTTVAPTTTTTTTVASTTTTTTTVASLPTLPTPTLTYDTGWNVYPSSVYANVTVTNHSYTNTYTASLGTQNPEFPEEFNLSGLTPNQSYTVNVTASRAGYISSTGSITFAATPGSNPTTTTTTAAPGCTMPNVIGLTSTQASNAIVASGWLYEDTEYTSVGATAGNNDTVQAQDPAPGTVAQCGLNSGITLYAYSAPTTTTTTTITNAPPIAVPSGGSVTLTGSNTPGSVITASTSGWSPTPTSYNVIITTTTSGTPTAASPVVSSGTGTSVSYTITSVDAANPVNIFKAFATATNASGTSTQVESGTISAAPAATTTTTVAPVATTTTTTTVAPVTPTTTTTTTAAPTTTTTTAAPCQTFFCEAYGEEICVGDLCPSAPTTTTTTAAPTTTTTTAAPNTNTTCTSQNVINGICASSGCDSDGCGSGAACSTGVQSRCGFQ